MAWMPFQKYKSKDRERLIIRQRDKQTNEEIETKQNDKHNSHEEIVLALSFHALFKQNQWT